MNIKLILTEMELIKIMILINNESKKPRNEKAKLFYEKLKNKFNSAIEEEAVCKKKKI